MDRDPTSRSDAISFTWIAAAAFVVIVPFFWLGTPSGHDFEFHFNSWVEVVEHWQQGVIFPHWAALAHYGYGEARFIFYPPASWTLGALLGKILPWTIVPAAYIWISLVLAGTAMYALAGNWVNKRDALFAAILYLANPYSLLVVYWRSAQAELLAAAYVPLLLLWVLRSDESSNRVVPPLAMLLALGWLTNIPAAVMMQYSLALLAVVVAVRRRTWKPVLNACYATSAGAALAAIYLVPAFHQQSWASLGQVFSPGVRPQDNFLFRLTSDADHNRFNLLVSCIAVWEIALLVLVLALWRRKPERTQWWPLTIWGAATAFVMLNISSPLWRYLPKLQYVQLPWRWLVCLNVPVAMALFMALRRWWSRLLVTGIFIAAVPFLAHRVLAPWWDTAGDIREMVDNQQSGIGNEGADEYVPAGTDPYAIDQNAPPARFEGAGDAKIQIVRWNAEDRAITADSNSSGELVLRLFAYPLWKVQVNGRPVQTKTTRATGQLVIPLPAGRSDVQVRFVEGWDRSTGAAISLATLFALALWYKRGSRSSTAVSER